ncbi:hypothetical protein [Halomonas icarae]|uniref:hypothetical protein n=1 Tax=Halomonas icarae TaxID=2691040 RepID=UPI001929F84C|nr:hypothetical protein [Halomonas icarae]
MALYELVTNRDPARVMSLLDALPPPLLAQFTGLDRALLDEGKLIARPADPAPGHVLRITAVEDALVPGQLATLERALQR